MSVALGFALFSFPTMRCAQVLRTRASSSAEPGRSEKASKKVQNTNTSMSPISPSGEACKHNERSLIERQEEPISTHLKSDDPFVIDHEPRVYRTQILPHGVGIWEFRDDVVDEDTRRRDF